MQNEKKFRLTMGMVTAAIATTVIVGAGLSLRQGVAFSQENSQQQIDEVWQIVDRNYVDGSFNNKNWQSIRRQYLARNYPNQEQSYVAIREMLKKLGDPYTRFMNPKEFADFQERSSGQRVGVGIQLSMDEKTKKLVIIAPIEDSSAAKAGIISKDVILKINGKSTKGLNIDKAVRQIRGQAGTSVVLTIQRDGQTIGNYKLLRQIIETHPVFANYRQNEGIGYVRLKEFTANATSEMQTEIQQLEHRGAQGYILDLRSNPGGLLYSAIEIARMFVNDGKIVSTKTRQGINETQFADRTAIVVTNKPIFVLVDGGSASASEILAGTLKDNNRAQLVGTKTFGKGLVQSVRRLSSGAGMAVTIAKYYTPNGIDINRKGIQPDVEVKITKEQMQVLRKNPTKVATSDDPQYVKAQQLLKAQIAATDNTRKSS
jgi:carboxyl-terminal processing protease